MALQDFLTRFLTPTGLFENESFFCIVIHMIYVIAMHSDRCLSVNKCQDLDTPRHNYEYGLMRQAGQVASSCAH